MPECVPRRLSQRNRQSIGRAAEPEPAYDASLSSRVGFSTTAAALHPCVLIRTYRGNWTQVSRRRSLVFEAGFRGRTPTCHHRKAIQSFRQVRGSDKSPEKGQSTMHLLGGASSRAPSHQVWTSYRRADVWLLPAGGQMRPLIRAISPPELCASAAGRLPPFLRLHWPARSRTYVESCDLTIPNDGRMDSYLDALCTAWRIRIPGTAIASRPSNY